MVHVVITYKAVKSLKYVNVWCLHVSAITLHLECEAIP